MRTLIANANEAVGNEVYIEGWVHRIRELKSVTFIIIRDRSGLIQCVFEGKPDWLETLKLESVVKISGMVKSASNKYGSVEILGNQLEILVAVQSDLPIQINGRTLDIQLDTMLNNRVLSLRHERNQAVFRLQAMIVSGFRAFLNGEGFLEMFTPKIVKEGAEGGSEIFKLDYFGERAFLAQSPQFYKQMMVISGFERVYEVGSVYRAEQHSTNRHLNEYVSMDFEMGFIRDEEEVMEMEENLLKSLFLKLKTEGETLFETLEVQCPEVPDRIPRIKMSEAVEILREHYGRIDLEGDLDPQGERQIAAFIKEKYNSEFVFITHYPRRKRPMYTMYCNEEETNSFDLLFRGLEITTGGQRIHELDKLVENMKFKGVEPEQYKSYLEAFKYGAPTHGGLAIGLERLTAQIIGMPNIREASLFPRDQQRLIP